MRWLALPAGAALLYLALLDLFRSLVVPRATLGRLRLARLLFIAAWRPWRWLGVRRRSVAKRERMLAIFAPLFFLIALMTWAFLALLGYTLMFWSPAFSAGVEMGDPPFTTTLYFTGTTLFTIGFGDIVATGAARALAVAAGATGLGIIALVIAYLPVFYGAFNRREVGILLLDARAGSPPSGAELLRRVGGQGLERTLLPTSSRPTCRTPFSPTSDRRTTTPRGSRASARSSTPPRSSWPPSARTEPMSRPSFSTPPACTRSRTCTSSSGSPSAMPRSTARNSTR
jgi:hypothetical protein